MGKMMNIKDIRDQVEKRLEEEAALGDGSSGKGDPKAGGDGDGPPDSKFIRACLYKNMLGDGELFKRLHRDHFVFNKSKNCWMVWQGHNWVIDKLNCFALAAVDNVAKVYKEEAKRVSKQLNSLDDDGDAAMKEGQLKVYKKMLNRRATDLRGPQRPKKCLEFACNSENSIAIDGNEIDQEPWLLPCANGVINLKTGELEAGRQLDYLTKASFIEWPEEGIEAKCPNWENFLLEIMDGNEELVWFLQRLLGMSLIGKVIVGMFVVFSGRGRNGKGTLIETVMSILNKDPEAGLAWAVRSEMLLDQGRINSSSGPTADIMALRGRRLITASETDQNCKISPSRVKWLTGEDTLSGRSPNDKYEVNFDPTHTLILQTNNDPHAPADDYAFWERMIKIPFNLSFVTREPTADFERPADLNLKDNLKAEYPAILAWLVRGCLEFQEVGLKRPAAVKAAVEAYKKEEDIIGDFIDECCVIGDGFSVGATKVYERFVEWWHVNVSNREPKMRRFGTLFTKRFKKVKSSTMKYVGVGLLAETGEIDPENM